MARKHSARLFAALCVVALLPLAAAAQDGEPDSARARWLAGRLVPLDDLSGEAGDARLDAFLDALSGTRVVAFGEPTHGDGTAFALRSRLTRALVERAGFDVLAIETLGLFDDPATAIDAGAAWVWSGSAQARPGLDYALARDDLALTGIDVQHLSPAPRFDEAAEALQRADAIDPRWPDVEAVLSAAFDDPFAPVDTAMQARVLDAVADYVAALEGAGETPAALFLANARANALTAWRQSYAPRDRQMGENLLHVAREAHPDARIVVWAASSHALRALAPIDNLDPKWSYDDAVPMGGPVADALGEDYYVIAFTACGGTYGASHLGLDAAEIAPPPAGSLEALACAAPFEEAAFIDLRRLAADEAGAWLRTPLLARPLGYQTMRAAWPDVLDGFVVIREMRPSTPAARED